MPTQIPFNKENLWAGKIQKANYPPPVQKPDMDLIPLTYHNGQQIVPGAEYNRILKRFCDPDGLPKTYAEYSRKYWEGVELRKEQFRKEKLERLQKASQQYDGFSNH